jgi:hypothetical protein
MRTKLLPMTIFSLVAVLIAASCTILGSPSDNSPDPETGNGTLIIALQTVPSGQPVTDEHIIGYLTASVTAEGVTCTVHRPFEMFYTS